MEKIQIKFASLNELETFQYIDFDEIDDLIEDANWIIECRADEKNLLKQLSKQYL